MKERGAGPRGCTWGRGGGAQHCRGARATRSCGEPPRKCRPAAKRRVSRRSLPLRRPAARRAPGRGERWEAAWGAPAARVRAAAGRLRAPGGLNVFPPERRPAARARARKPNASHRLVLYTDTHISARSRWGCERRAPQIDPTHGDKRCAGPPLANASQCSGDGCVCVHVTRQWARVRGQPPKRKKREGGVKRRHIEDPLFALPPSRFRAPYTDVSPQTKNGACSPPANRLRRIAVCRFHRCSPESTREANNSAQATFSWRANSEDNR